MRSLRTTSAPGQAATLLGMRIFGGNINKRVGGGDRGGGSDQELCGGFAGLTLQRDGCEEAEPGVAGTAHDSSRMSSVHAGQGAMTLRATRRPAVVGAMEERAHVNAAADASRVSCVRRPCGQSAAGAGATFDDQLL